MVSCWVSLKQRSNSVLDNALESISYMFVGFMFCSNNNVHAEDASYFVW